MMTAESMLSKRPVSRIALALFFLLTLFSSRIDCIPKYFKIRVVLKINYCSHCGYLKIIAGQLRLGCILKSTINLLRLILLKTTQQPVSR